MSIHPTLTPQELIGAPYAHQQGIYGRDIGVAVFDTGIYPHKDFFHTSTNLSKQNNAKTTVTSRILCHKDFLHNKTFPYDNSGHGTHIAGIIASNGIINNIYVGIAPACHLIGIKILDKNGSGKVRTMLQGIRWAIDHRKQYNIRIANISIGALHSGQDTENTALIQGVNALWDSGIVVVAAAGNKGPAPQSITAPGVSRKIITVGASDDYKTITLNGTHIKNYSSRGPTGSCIMKPEILAPGSKIISCQNAPKGYCIKSGTSMSTPFVSGAIALLLEKYPSMTNKDVKIALYQTARNLGYPKEQQGWGLLNIPALLNFITLS